MNSSSESTGRIKWDFPSPFTHNITVDHTAIDSYGHVNNSVYLRWMDDCARAHSKALGIDCDDAVDFGFGMAVRELSATYLAAAFEHDGVVVGTWIISSDQKLRLKRHFQIVRIVDQVTLVHGNIDYVCINIATGRPAKMPSEFKQRYLPVVVG